MSEDIKKEQEVKLSSAQYWEWRCTIEELANAKHLLTVACQRQRLLELEAEVAKLKVAANRQSVRDASANKDNIEKDYHSFREKLEKDLGVELKDCVIDEYDYTVKKLK